MLMFKRLPCFVILQEKKYNINVDFRNMISFENKVLNKSFNEIETIRYGLQNFYLDFKNDENYKKILLNIDLYKEACEKLIWFYKCGREDYHKNDGNGNLKAKQIYNYEFDDEYIYGAFYEQYGVDLTCDKVHWWKFKSFLKCLKEDTEFVKIKNYRAYSGKDKNILELKKYWELPLPIEEEERLNKLYETLK